jgi:hypothetical protein
MRQMQYDAGNQYRESSTVPTREHANSLAATGQHRVPYTDAVGVASTS